MDQSVSHLQPGSTLQNGRYTITRMIGAGGFGCTYEVTSGESRFCIKEFFMSQNCTRDAQTGNVSIINTSQIDLVNRSKKKFLEEATVLRMMDHPSIVHVVDIFEEHGTAYFAMDYIEGQSLQAMVDTKGPVYEQEAISYMKQVANALDFVHRHHRLHLDIKPDNIMVDGYGRAILIDFGASKYIDQESDGGSTSVFQTPGYAPGEQVNGDVSSFGPFTDIYGLGATFYKVLSGITPVSSPERADGTELEPLPASISPNTQRAVMAALSLNRKKRPQSATEFIDMIAPADSDDIQADIYAEVTPECIDDNGDYIDAEIVEPDMVSQQYVEARTPAGFSPRRGKKRKKKTSAGESVIIILAVFCLCVFILMMLRMLL